MGWFADDSHEAQAYETVVNAPHKAHLSHELIAAAGAYEAAKAFNEHQEKNGHPGSHDKAKQIAAGAAAAFITKIVETKGLDAIDHHKAKKLAEERAHEVYDQQGY